MKRYFFIVLILIIGLQSHSQFNLKLESPDSLIYCNSKKCYASVDITFIVDSLNKGKVLLESCYTIVIPHEAYFEVNVDDLMYARVGMGYYILNDKSELIPPNSELDIQYINQKESIGAIKYKEKQNWKIARKLGICKEDYENSTIVFSKEQKKFEKRFVLDIGARYELQKGEYLVTIFYANKNMHWRGNHSKNEYTYSDCSTSVAIKLIVN